MSETCRKHIEQHKINNRGTSTHSSYLSRCKRSKTSPDMLIKSYYCLEEINKVPYGKRKHINQVKPPNTSVGQVGSKENGETDIIFLKKLLSFNKKQELLINKKLSELLREQEINDSKEKRHPRLDSSSSESAYKAKRYNFPAGQNRSRNRDYLEEYNVSSKVGKDKITYDINGRRVYHLSDSDGELDEEDSPENSGTNSNFRSQSNSSIEWDEMSHDRNSRKDSKRPVQIQSNRNGRRRYQSELARRSARCPSRMAKSTIGIGLEEKEEENVKNRLQTVVAHCREVPRNQEHSEGKKKIHRVWDYKPKYGGGDIRKHS